MPNAALSPASNRLDVIRQPLGVRAYVVIFLCIWCGSLGAGLIAAAVHGSPALVFLLLMLAFGLTLGYRIFRLSVAIGPHLPPRRHGTALILRARSEAA